MKNVKGYMIKMIFKSDSWGVALFKDAANKNLSLKIKGNIAEMHPKVLYEIKGNLEVSQKYGKIFSVEEWHQPLLNSKDNIISFFSSKKFPTIGKEIASKIVNHFAGEDIINQIKENDFKNFLEIKNVPFNKLMIVKSVLEKEEQDFTEIFLLNNLKLSILDKIKNKVLDPLEIKNILENNFYLFALNNIHNESFLEIDKIALYFGVSPDSSERISAWSFYYTNEYLFSSGNTFITFEILFKKIIEMFELTKETFANHLIFAKDNTILIFNDKKIYTKQSFEDEKNIANTIKKIIAKNNPKENNDEKIDQKIKEVENNLAVESGVNDFHFSSSQKIALINFVKNNISIVTGGPGTGKSTLIKAIIKLYNKITPTDINEDSILLAAPTGKAARRIEEIVKTHRALTIHQAIGMRASDDLYSNANLNNFRENIWIAKDLIIFDECSMIDNALFSRFLTKLKAFNKIVLIGDNNQLPSVGYGDLFGNLIDSKTITTTFLGESFRQQHNNGINILANDIINEAVKEENLINYNNVNFYEEITDANQNSFLNLYNDLIKENNEINDVQIICPMYKGTVGINNLNELIQNSKKSKIKVSNPLHNYYLDDKILYLKNDSTVDLSNGDIGQIIKIQKEQSKAVVCEANFSNRIVKLEQLNLTNTTLGYVCSVHKTQGNEYKEVVLVLDSSANNFFLSKSIIYTAITRAKKNLHVFANKTLFLKAIKKNSQKRLTTLIERLQQPSS